MNVVSTETRFFRGRWSWTVRASTHRERSVTGLAGCCLGSRGGGLALFHTRVPGKCSGSRFILRMARDNSSRQSRSPTKRDAKNFKHLAGWDRDAIPGDFGGCAGRQLRGENRARGSLIITGKQLLLRGITGHRGDAVRCKIRQMGGLSGIIVGNRS